MFKNTGLSPYLGYKNFCNRFLGIDSQAPYSLKIPFQFVKHCQLEFELELYLLIVKTTKDKKFTRAEEALQ